MTAIPMYLAVAASADAAASLPGFIPVRYYKPGTELPNELGVVENCRFLAAFDPALCTTVAAEPRVRKFILPVVKGSVIYTLEQDQ